MAPTAAVAKDKPKDVCKKGTAVDASGQPLSKKECKRAIKSGQTPSSIIAIAWTERGGGAGYQAGSDVLIAQFLDDDLNGPDAGDTIHMGRYPTSFSAPYGFKNFTVGVAPPHVLDGYREYTPGAYLHAFFDCSGDCYFIFETASRQGRDEYQEGNPVFGMRITDGPSTDIIDTNLGTFDFARSPSKPEEEVWALGRVDSSDDAFIEVEVY